MFEDLLVDHLYPFSVSKSGFETARDSFVLAGDTTIEVALTQVTGIDEQDLSGIRIFPNPATGEFSVQSVEIIQQIELCSTDGRILKSVICDDYLVSISPGDLKKGVYLVRVYTGPGIAYINKMLIME